MVERQGLAMGRAVLAVIAGLVLTFLAGCGGGGSGDGGELIPPPDSGSSETVQVGPLLVRPASAAGFVAQEIPNPSGPISLVAFHGSRITNLASQAFLDRIVFSRGLASDVWVCNLDGSGAVPLIDNNHSDKHPVWSPDGRQIALDRQPLGQDTEIVVANADGSGAHALTVNADFDSHPDWSPTGDQIAFQTNRTGNAEIFLMHADGAVPINLSNNAAADMEPDWCPRIENPFIAFRSQRDADDEIYRMAPTGANQVRLTNQPGSSREPAIRPDGLVLAFAQDTGSVDIWTIPAGALGAPTFLVATAANEGLPAWSSDGRFICFSSFEDGDDELMLRETTEPFRTYQITNNTVFDGFADLGSPTLQTDRVIIGPAGSDWGGTNPIWSSSDAGIVAWAADGYRNFVRIGIPANQLSTLSVTPLAATAQNGFIGGHGAPVGVVIEAADIVNLREDGGRGASPVVWQLDPLDATAVVLYFDAQTGKLLSALVLRDQVSPAATGGSAAAVVQRADAGGIMAEGSFAAVFDASGARVADAASEVLIATGAVSVLR